MSVCLIVSLSALSPSIIFCLSVTSNGKMENQDQQLIQGNGQTEFGLTANLWLIYGNGQTEFGLTSHSVVLIKESSKRCQKASIFNFQN